MARAKKLAPDFDYSDEEQLALWKQTLAKLSFAQEVEIMGKRITRADLPEVRKQIEWLERRIAAAAAGQGKGVQLYEGRIV